MSKHQTSFCTTVPLTRIDPEDRSYLASELREAHVDRVLVALPDLALQSPEKWRKILGEVRENVGFLREEGFEVGVWISTLGHGGRLAHEDGSDNARFTGLVGMEGVTEEASYCPLDPDFRAALRERVRDLAGTGADLILLDDDYRLSKRSSGNACCCDRHMELLRRKLGDPIGRVNLRKKVFGGAPTPERKAWLDVMGKTLEDLAKDLRSAADEENPDVRMGFCAVHTTWGADGTDAIRLTRIFAGKNPPILRLIGAPSWVANHGFWDLTQVIELERMEAAFCKDTDFEVISEGDCYPRPRFQTPASYLECFDFALRADGNFDGILKYMLDYTSTARYETGYLKRHNRDYPLLESLGRFLDGLDPVGVRVLAYPNQTERSVFPEEGADPGRIANAIYPAACRMLSPLGIPTVYEGRGICQALFGDSAASLPLGDLGDAVLLDAPAARTLSERGADVGLNGLTRIDSPAFEDFPGEKERVALPYSDGNCYAPVGLSPDAAVLSTFSGGTPASYTYRNAKGQKFLVFLFDSHTQPARSALYLSYSRAAELQKTMAGFFGTPLPVTVEGHPFLYLMCRESSDRSELAVTFINAFPDEIDSPVLTLRDAYSSVSCLNCRAEIAGNRVTLEGIIPPYGFGAIRLNKSPRR